MSSVGSDVRLQPGSMFLITYGDGCCSRMVRSMCIGIELCFLSKAKPNANVKCSSRRRHATRYKVVSNK